MKRSILRIRHILYGIYMKIAGSTIQLPGGVTVYLDPFDKRGQAIKRQGSDYDQEAFSVWKNMVSDFEPTCIIDVGANYGIFGLTFGGSVPVHLIEANPSMIPYLRRSSIGNSDIHLHPVAASDRAGSTLLNLHIDPAGYRDSGGSSLDARGNNSVATKTQRIDRLVRLDGTDRLAFKIDVEGHELAALSGMSGLLSIVPEWCGLVESTSPSLLEDFGRCIKVTSRDYLLIPK